MKRYALVPVLVLLNAGNLLAETPPSNLGVSIDVRDEVRNSYLFVFRDSVSAHDVPTHARTLAAQLGGQLTHTYTHAIRGFAAKLPDEAAAHILARNPLIAHVEQDGVMFAFGRPGPIAGAVVPCSAPQQTPWGITRVGGSAVGVEAGRSAWVIDTGIDFEHPDLNVDTARSVSFLRKRTSADDGNGHGTHVAGTIGARDNGCDVVGVAAGVPLVAVRVLDSSGSGSTSGVIKGVDYVAQSARVGDVANLSLGGAYNATLNMAVEGAAARGIFFALAAGNESADASLTSPASASGPNIYTVSAIDGSDAFAWFSNYGAPVDCAAPGVGIVSTRNGGGTTTMQGTSMAAPHVAGLLLFGTPRFAGGAAGDPDGQADPICVR